MSTRDIGRRALEDKDQLLTAGQQGRCFVTQDYADFAKLTQLFFAQGLPHAGVLFISPALAAKDPEAVAAAIARYAEEHPDGLPPYTVDWVEPLPDE